MKSVRFSGRNMQIQCVAHGLSAHLPRVRLDCSCLPRQTMKSQGLRTHGSHQTLRFIGDQAAAKSMNCVPALFIIPKTGLHCSQY